VIPISSVQIGPREKELVGEVLDSGMLAQGPMVARMEAQFAELCGVRHAVAVSNGTVSLMAALQAMGVGPGDEVLTTPFTFVATLNAVLHVGAVVRFADIDADDFLIDPQSCAPFAGRIKAVVPVHLYGQSADVPALRAVLGADIPLLEDAAQAHGATLDGRTVGSFGVGSFSFYGTKNLTTGEGGMVTTDDDHLADQIRLLRNQGMRARYQYELPGHNFRMTDLQAAIGVAQLERVGDIIATRNANAAALTAGLGDLEGLVTPIVRPNRTHVWHQYTVRITENARLSRNAFMEHLQAAGVGCGVYYPALVHDYDCYREHPRIRFDDTPIAARVVQEVVSLPVHPTLTSADLERIIEVVRGALS
jgi:dTDP-4-amino-4,6-dideoxygalactose transaminase